tara:strand:- start:39 stop:266 length:228 start_codon:yes stop_codon:yes gene_type:complete
MFTKVQKRLQFDNGYTMSILRKEGTYGALEGLFEVAVVHNDRIIYDTPVTHDVVGWADLADLFRLKEEISSLPPR